ncbi:MAG: hypothetical protein ACK5RN_02630, partial [bacterium]
DIAGKGVARADSLIAALRLAGEMAAARASGQWLVVSGWPTPGPWHGPRRPSEGDEAAITNH